MNRTERFERLLDLKVQEASFGLSQTEAAELRGLIAEFPDWDGDESLSLTAANIQLVGIQEEQMPAHLMRSIEDEFSRLYPEPNRIAPKTSTEENPSSKALFDTNWLGWALAGAFGVALVFNSLSSFDGTTPSVPVALTVQQEFDELLSNSQDVVRNEWVSPTPDKQLGFEGEVVWSETKQKGFMKFKGLPVNDKSKETYQLWIFDSNQKSEHPIDGGIFDVEGDGEVIVPIQAKLEVKNASLFAVTVEKPGGVVVSSREKLLSIASVKEKS